MNMVTKVKLQIQSRVMVFFPETSLSSFTYHRPGLSQTILMYIHGTATYYCAGTYYIPSLNHRDLGV